MKEEWASARVLGPPLRDAVLNMLAILATLACALALDPQPGIGILAVVLCLSFSRSQLDHDLRGRLEAAIVLPLIGVVALGIGSLLLHQRWLGALVFVAGMFASVWLRQFGTKLRRASSLVGLPLIVIVMTPHIPTHQTGSMPAWLVPIVVALLALAWVATVHALGRWLNVLPQRQGPAATLPVAVAPKSDMRPNPTTRLALQMAVGIGGAFVVGFLFFPQRWAWIVLTTFIVSTGNCGRLDVAYKCALRVLGAGAGTLLALPLSLHAGHHDASTIAMILAAVFVGLWLRPLNYAWWALFVTMALALLQGFEGTSAQSMLALRLEEIAIGAAIGLASAWFVYPLRSTAVLRRRIADVLALLADAFDPNTPGPGLEVINAAFSRLREVAPSFRALRRVTNWLRPAQPADWIDAVMACQQPARALIELRTAPPDVRRAIGLARQALRQPAASAEALQTLSATVQAACPTLDNPKQAG